MPKRPKSNDKLDSIDVDLEDIVPHPRFGALPHLPGGIPTTHAVRQRYAYQMQIVFPETKTAADPEKQNYTVIPRAYYVDVLKQCRDCNRRFIFFAREQRHWYEELKFVIDADCVHCPECRKSTRKLRRRFARYSETINAPDLDDDTLATLMSDAVFLWNHSLLNDEQKLRRLRNLGIKRIPDHPVVNTITRLLE